jgi:tetratricopeptide (TPR) repeat protein
MKLFVVARILLVTIALGTTPEAHGSTLPSFTFLPGHTLAQKQERDLIERGEYKDALAGWVQAFTGTEFAESSTGVALHALLLFENGATLSGLEELSRVNEPGNIAKSVSDLWAKAAPSSNPVWAVTPTKFLTKWISIFGAQTFAASEAWKIQGLSTDAEMKNAEKLLKRVAANSAEKAWLDYELALAFAVRGDGKDAGLYLQAVLDNQNSRVGEDQALMTAARVFYQDGNFETAKKYYSKIPQRSPLWLESIEERAWADVRSQDYEQALAEMKTLLAPVFSPAVGPEPFFLSSLARLKICDYYGVFTTLKEFKTRFRDRLKQLQDLSATGTTPAAAKALNALESDGRLEGVGSDIQFLPRGFDRDVTIERSAQVLRELRKETPTLTGQMKSWGERSEGHAQVTIRERLKTLAARDLEDTAKILRKLNIVDVEAIQRSHIKTNLADGKAKAQPKGDVIHFPDEGEVWLDELTHYTVDAKECQTRGGKKL